MTDLTIAPIILQLRLFASIPNTLMQISVPNSFAFYQDNVFKIATIDKTGKVSIQILSPGFPNVDGYGWESDDTCDMIWMRRNRGIYLYDLKAKKGVRLLGSGDYNNKLGQIMIADPEKKLVIVEAIVPGPKDDWILGYYVLFDLINNKDDPTTYDTEGNGVFRLKQSGLLYGEYPNQGDTLEYRIIDPTFQKRQESKLTKKLQELQFGASALTFAKIFSAEKRLFIGKIPNPIPNTKPYGIQVLLRWDEDYEDFSITPLAPLYPDGVEFSDWFMLNQDSSWVQAELYPEGLPQRWAFMHLGPYPGGISPAIKSAYMDKGINGVWITHETWGPCFVSPDPENPKQIKVYRMSDALELFAKMK